MIFFRLSSLILSTFQRLNTCTQSIVHAALKVPAQRHFYELLFIPILFFMKGDYPDVVMYSYTHEIIVYDFSSIPRTELLAWLPTSDRNRRMHSTNKLIRIVRKTSSHF